MDLKPRFSKMFPTVFWIGIVLVTGIEHRFQRQVLIRPEALVQPEASRFTLASYFRLVLGETTLIAAEAILGPSREMSNDAAERTVEWIRSDGATITAVFNKSGILIKRTQKGLKF